MKKGSTAAAKQSRNISQQKLTIGLDLGDRRVAEVRGFRIKRPDVCGHTDWGCPASRGVREAGCPGICTLG